MSVGIGGIPVVTDARSDEAAPIPIIKTFFNACATSAGCAASSKADSSPPGDQPYF